MDVAALRSKVTFQKNETVTDKYGNHKNAWTDYYTCFATIGGEGLASSKEEQAAGTTVEDFSMTVSIRYCKKAAAIDSTHFRVMFMGEIYNIVNIDHIYELPEEVIEVYLQEGAALMAQTIKIDQLADTVMKGMEEYAKLAAEDLKKDVQKAGKTVKQQIESTAPKKTGKYSKSWAVKKTRETSDSIQIVVHSKRYQLTHLLEFGHAKRGGGRTRAFPHIAPAEQAGIEQLTRDIERDLQKGG